jgi:uncharacterized sulfatase
MVGGRRSIPPASSHGFAAAACRFLALLPALLLAGLCARAFELVAGMPTGTATDDALHVAGLALRQDVLGVLRYLPALFLLSLPFLLLRSQRARRLGVGLLWSLLLLLQGALAQYFLVARVPLGADLFAYSAQEIRETLAPGSGPGLGGIAALVLPLVVLWPLLAWLSRRPALIPSRFTAVGVFVIAVLTMALAPSRLQQRAETEDAYTLSLAKAAYFFDDSLAYAMRRNVVVAQPIGASAAAAAPTDGSGPRDPRYPFLHVERTPDVLGPHFAIDARRPPNLVFIVVEGLGRSFSGPDAALGSFTPFLDALAARSLYWDNFLAVQGRTFAMLPSLFGSLPFGDKGFSALGERMPRHDTLLSVLHGQGYHLKFYGGFDLDFDNERLFMRRQGVATMVGDGEDSAAYAQHARANSWGYADNELLAMASARENRDTPQPYVSVIQTMTMHTPYTFPGQARYAQRFEQRLQALGLDATQKQAHRAYRDIYTSIMYTDEALRRYFDRASRDPAYANTIFIVTGDHRLPEIPMATRIERYHVPLLLFSPLLAAPARIKAVSSHFDVAPSLLAFLAHNYGIRTPRAVTWIGSGLDMAPFFRSRQDFPLKQTKTNLVDYVSGDRFLSHDTLYAIGDGMDIEPVRDDAAVAQVQARFARFRAANARFAQDPALKPDGATRLVAYDERARSKPAPLRREGAALAVQGVRVPVQAADGALAVEVDFSNDGVLPSAAFVPLVVLLSEQGRELSESYGVAMSLAAGQHAALRVPVATRGLAAGRYFMTVIASDPATGKRIGAGRHRIPVQLRD